MNKFKMNMLVILAILTVTAQLTCFVTGELDNPNDPFNPNRPGEGEKIAISVSGLASGIVEGSTMEISVSLANAIDTDETVTIISSNAALRVNGSSSAELVFTPRTIPLPRAWLLKR